MELYLTRHGRTPGNLAGRYVGRTNQPLAPEGVEAARAAGVFPEVTRVYVTPLLRTKQTAAIRFPNAKQIVVNDLIEMDFGDFEGRSADELTRDHGYSLWLESSCETRCPGGESVADLSRRAGNALICLVEEAAARGEQRLTFVIHGGVIMSLMQQFADDGRQLFGWLVGNCGGYRVTLDPARFSDTRRFDSFALL